MRLPEVHRKNEMLLFRHIQPEKRSISFFSECGCRKFIGRMRCFFFLVGCDEKFRLHFSCKSKSYLGLRGKSQALKRLWNPTPSTPLRAGSNVERRDVRMGHLAAKTIGKILYLRIEEVLYLKTRDLELMY